MRKQFSMAAIIAAVSFIGMVLTSCSGQELNPAPARTVKSTEFIEVEKKVPVGIHAWYSEGTLVVNGNKALTAAVTPDSLTITMPAQQHAAAVITDFGTNRWSDSNGNGFTGELKSYNVDNLTMGGVAILPATKFSTITKIHPKVSMVKGNFNLNGFFDLLLEDGTVDHQDFTLPVENGTYFLCDTAVDVRIITETEIQIQYDTVTVTKDSIVYKDSVVYVDKIEYVPVTEYIHINHSIDEVVISGLGYADILFSVDDAWMKWHVALDSLFINRDENGFGKANITSANQAGFTADDKQKGVYTSTTSGMTATATTKSLVFTATGDEDLKMGTVNIEVVASFTDTDGEQKTKTFNVSPFYFHKLIVKAEPSVIVPEITTEYTYQVDTVRTAVKDSEGNLTGQKMKVTVTRNEDGKKWKVQYLAWETGLLCPTITGTQVGSNQMLRATTATPEAYTADGWSGTDTSREGFSITATSKEYKFRTAFAAVPGFGQSEESVAECNIVFGTRTCTFTDPENPSFTFTITPDGVGGKETSVKIVEDMVGTDEAAKAEVNGRGLEYEYIGTHFLTVDQYVGGVKVLTQSRNEQLLYPKN